MVHTTRVGQEVRKPFFEQTNAGKNRLLRRMGSGEDFLDDDFASRVVVEREIRKRPANIDAKAVRI